MAAHVEELGGAASVVGEAVDVALVALHEAHDVLKLGDALRVRELLVGGVGLLCRGDVRGRGYCSIFSTIRVNISSMEPIPCIERYLPSRM